MITRWRAFAASVAGLLSLGATEAPDAVGDCLMGLKPALVSGNFSGSVDCQRDRLSVKKVGELQTQWNRFTVYSYHYELAPVCPECAVHGGRRILFMERGSYVGQYRADFAHVTIKDGSLVFQADAQEPVTVKFTKDGPPDELWVDGELIRFFE